MYKITLPGGYDIHVYNVHMTDHMKLAAAIIRLFDSHNHFIVNYDPIQL